MKDITRDEKYRRLNNLGQFRELELSEDFANPFWTQYGFISEDNSVALDAVTGELVISEKFRSDLDRLSGALGDDDLTHLILDEFEYTMPTHLWPMIFPDRVGIIFFNRSDSVGYFWDRDPDQEEGDESETLVERLITYGKANLTVEWGD